MKEWIYCLRSYTDSIPFCPAAGPWVAELMVQLVLASSSESCCFYADSHWLVSAVRKSKWTY